MNRGELMALITDTEKRAPGFVYEEVRQTWLRRYVKVDWFGLPVGVVWQTAT